MEKIKKALWFIAGIICLGITYLGTFVPGLPWSTPAIGATYCFARSSKRFHDYMLNHKLFGPVIKNWNEKSVFPTWAKWSMFASMDGSLIIMWLATHNWKIVLGMSAFFAIILLWASRLPGSKEDAEQRIAQGKKLGWFK
jgi:uncharacterized membrane protein YbaN (DUF454 family)